MEDGKTVHLSDVKELESISVKNINFNGNINDIDKNEFEDILDVEMVLYGDKNLGNMTVYGKVYIESEQIGDVLLHDFENRTIKRDEPFDFQFVEFGK